MKKIISVTLAIMMIASFMAISTYAAAFTTDSILFTQDYENTENKIFGGASAVLESEESTNHVTTLGVATERNWEVNPPAFTIDPGAKLTFKAMVRDAKSLSLVVEVYAGDRAVGSSRQFVFITNKLEPNVWYDGEIIIRGANWTYALEGIATLTHPTTGEVVTAKTGSTLSNNGLTVDETDDGVDNPVSIVNYSNRIRFLTNLLYGAAGTKDTSAEPVADWIIDDIVCEKLMDVPTKGVFHEQDFDDHTNTLFKTHVYNSIKTVYTDEERGYVYDGNYTASTSTYSDMLTATIPSELLPAGTDATVTTFDICKKAPSAGVVVTLTRDDYVGRIGIVSKQLRTDVWYTFAIVRPVNSSLSVYRKAEGDTEWTQLTGVAAATAVDAPAATAYADVENPIYITNTQSGNASKDLARFLISTVGYMNVYQGADEPYNVAAAPLTGSYYLIDNFKVSSINDLALDITKADNAITANVIVNENDPADTTEKNVFIAYYNEENALIDVDFDAVVNGEATLNISGDSYAGMDSAKLFLWDADNAPIMEEWDIADHL